MAKRKIRYWELGVPVEKLPLNTVIGTCPKCGRPLAVRKGKYGKYIYCKNIDCHTTMPIKNIRLMDEDALNILNLKKAEANKDIDKAREILMTCSENIKPDARWCVDKIYNKIIEESPYW